MSEKITTNNKSRVIILDRDGVINYERDNYVTTPDEWIALPGSLAAITKLHQANYQVAIVTNQSGIGKGLYSVNTLNRIHQRMCDQLKLIGGDIRAIFFCPHAPEDNCDCRKPKPGMFIELSNHLQCDLSTVYAVGDQLRDLQAAAAAGARPVLVKTGYGNSTLHKIKTGKFSKKLTLVPVYANLAEFVDELLTRSGL